MKPEISIIIVNRNTGDFIGKTVLHAKDLFFRNALPSEFIVVDNGSHDDSVTRIKNAFPDIVLIENRFNRGFSRAVNQALGVARGEYVLLLNSDAWPSENAIPQMYQYMKAHPKCGMIGGQLMNTDGTEQNSVDNFPTFWIEIFPKRLLKKMIPDRFPSKYRKAKSPIIVESLVGACLLVRASAINAVGLLDESFYFFMEETDWAYRFRKAGFDVVFYPEAIVSHGQGLTASRTWIPARREYYTSKYVFYGKHYGRLYRRCAQGLGLLRASMNMVSNGIGSIIFSFCRKRAYLYAHLVIWHIMGCPRSWGLQGVSKEDESLILRRGRDNNSVKCVVARYEEEKTPEWIESLAVWEKFLANAGERVTRVKLSTVRDLVFYQATPEDVYAIKRYPVVGWLEIIKNIALRSRARKECEAAWRAGKLGLAALPAVGYIEKRRACFLSESLLISKKLKGGQSADLIHDEFTRRGQPLSHMFLESLGKIAGQMHGNNIVHGDFHLGNIFIQEGAGPIVLDLHRMKFKSSLSANECLTDLGYLAARLSPENIQTLWDAYRQADPSCAKKTSVLKISEARDAILANKRKSRLRQAMRPKGSRVARMGGYEIIFAKGAYEAQEKSGMILPCSLDGYSRKSLVKHSRTSKIFKLDSESWGTCYYKIDLCRGPYDFVKNIFRLSRALRAWRSMVKLQLLGYDVPALIAAGEKRDFGIIWQESFLITQEIAGALPLGVYVRSKNAVHALTHGERKIIRTKLLQLTESLHGDNIFHADLKAANILALGQGVSLRLYVIDADRVYFKRKLSSRARVRNLAQLNASFLDEVALRERLRFFLGYAKGKIPRERYRVFLKHIAHETESRWREAGTQSRLMPSENR